jgi:hypothetical protein
MASEETNLNKLVVEQDESGGAEKGWRPTISHPPKVPNEDCKVLASGVDGVVLAVDIVWKDSEFFQRLNDLKAEAALREQPVPMQIRSLDGAQTLTCEVQASGKGGYEWMVSSPEYHFKLGNWMLPKSRPSAMIEIRSVALWMNGVVEAIDRLIQLLEGVGAHASVVKASRIDVCLDALVPEDFWRVGLLDHAVTRAQDMSLHFKYGRLTGIQIGKGVVLVRIYDKPLEIQTQSSKTWMYDIWNIAEVPEGHHVLRFEFQLRREALKDLAVDTIWHFTNHPRSLWAYCTEAWLRFSENPKAPTRYQKTLPFWKTIQENFLGGQHEHGLVRAKAVNVKRKQLSQQMMGQFTSLIAIGTENMAPCVRLEDHLAVVTDSAQLLGMDDYELTHRVRMKKGRYLKLQEKFDEAEAKRREYGLPTATKKVS